MANSEVRRAAKAAGVPLWAVAQRLGVSEATLSRRLRFELTEAERKRILSTIRLLEEGGYEHGKSAN